jgi:hypothetical protein
MATSLNALISDKTTDKTTLATKVGDGEAAKPALSEVLQELETLGQIQAIRDAALARATTMVAGSQAAVAPLQASAPYTSAAAAVAAGLAAKTKTEAGMSGVVAATLPMGGTYATYVGNLNTADTTLADATADEATKRITLDAKRGMIDVRIASLTSFASGVEARLSRAKALLTSATVAAQANSVAAAWWAFHHVKALLADVTAATGATLVTAVNTACDDYAAAYADWITARDHLGDAVTGRASAAAALAQADAQTLAALATFVG